MVIVMYVLFGVGELFDLLLSIGVYYVNMNNGVLYLVKGIVSGVDWVKLGSGGGSVLSEVLYVNIDGQFFFEF